MTKKLLFALSFALLLSSCSKKEDQAPAIADSLKPIPAASATTPVQPADNTTNTKTDSASVAANTSGKDKTSPEDVATKTTAPEPKLSGVEATAEKLARGYVLTTTIGKENKNVIKLVKTKKGLCENCWFFTYHIANKQELTVQTNENIASLYGKMKDLK